MRITSAEWLDRVPVERYKIEVAMLEAGFTSDGEWDRWQGKRGWHHESYPDVSVELSVYSPNDGNYNNAFHRRITCGVDAYQSGMRKRTFRYGKTGLNVPAIVKVALEVIEAACEGKKASRERGIRNRDARVAIDEAVDAAGVGSHHVQLRGGTAIITQGIPIDKLAGVLAYLKTEGIIE